MLRELVRTAAERLPEEEGGSAGSEDPAGSAPTSHFRQLDGEGGWGWPPLAFTALRGSAH